MTRVWLRRGAAIPVLLSVGLLAGCTGPGSPVGSQPASKISTTVPTKGHFTLRIWDAEGPGSSIGVLLNAWIRQFERLHPNITIQRVAPPGLANESLGAEYAATKLAAASSDPPDLVEGDTDAGGLLAPAIAAGLMMPLNGYVTAYGWNKRVASLGGFTQQQYSLTARRWGTGDIYAMPYYGNVLGVYYNKALLRRAGVGVPATFGAFEASLAAARRKGIIPIAFSENDQFVGGWLFQMLLGAFGGAQQQLNFILDDNGADIQAPASLRALETMRAWADSGYFPPGYQGDDYSTVSAQFAKGQELYMIDLSIGLSGYLSMGKNVGFFLMPTPSGATDVGSVNPTNWSFGIPVNAREKTIAAAFLNFITSPAAQAMMPQYGQLPAEGTAAPIPVGKPAVYSDIVRAWNSLRQSGTPPVAFIGSGSTISYVYQAVATNVQDVLYGRSSPQSALRAIQASWIAYQQAVKKGLAG